jgi:uncharacterized protein
MELTNDFRVPLPPADAWQVLTDIERIAPCMPGAQLQEVEGDEYRGIVKVKVGPITAQYKGAATFLERDEDGRRAVLRAEGRDTRGQGNASATITATLTADGDGTAVSIVTDLTVTGKVAQFGRGVLADVSAKLLVQFVECLESTVLTSGGTGGADGAGGPQAEEAVTGPGEVLTAPRAVADAPVPGAADATPTAPSGPRRIDGPEARPVDLVEAAGGSVAKRVGPAVAVVALLWLLRQLLRRKRA